MNPKRTLLLECRVTVLTLEASLLPVDHDVLVEAPALREGLVAVGARVRLDPVVLHHVHLQLLL